MTKQNLRIVIPIILVSFILTGIAAITVSNLILSKFVFIDESLQQEVSRIKKEINKLDTIRIDSTNH